MQEKALLDERAKLIERNKELSCLYEIAKIVAHTEILVQARPGKPEYNLLINIIFLKNQASR